MLNYFFTELVSPKYQGVYEKHKRMLFFLIQLFLFYVGWRSVYYFIWNTPELYQLEQDFMLSCASNIVETTVLILDLFRNDVIYIEAERIVRLVNSGGVTVSTPCVGIEMLYVFTVLIISYPSAWKKKVWFIPLGLICIHVINVLRITTLTLVSFYAPEQLDFNHKYVFVIVVYSFIFYMWVRWVKISERT
tara:strand:- start:3482 stop:4054 length:573 start_codon:yes stop_codon:yes gene_type:complete